MIPRAVIDEERVVGEVEPSFWLWPGAWVTPEDPLPGVDDEQSVVAAIGDQEAALERSIRRGRRSERWAGGGGMEVTGLRLIATTELSGEPPGPMPPTRYPVSPSVAAAAFVTGVGSRPAGAARPLDGSKRSILCARSPLCGPAQNIDLPAQGYRRGVRPSGLADAR